jgi:hypothetical protein
MMYYHGGLKKGHFPGSSTITYLKKVKVVPLHAMEALGGEEV